MTDNDLKKQPNFATKPPVRPNEQGSINVEGYVKIFDPTTKETFVEKRA